MRTKYDYFLKHNTYIQTYKFGMFKIYSPVYWWWTGSFSQSEVLSYLYLPSSFKLFLSLFLLVIQLAKESVSDQIGMITRSQEDKERYKLKDKEVRHACEEDKKDYLEGICLHLQDRKHTSQAGIAYNYIRVLKKPFTLRSRTIKDAQDRPIDDTDEIRERWRDYTESLYTKDQTIQAEWLAIPSIVVDPVPAVLPASYKNYQTYQQ